jgi:hypothetical protein
MKLLTHMTYMRRAHLLLLLTHKKKPTTTTCLVQKLAACMQELAYSCKQLENTWNPKAARQNLKKGRGLKSNH